MRLVCPNCSAQYEIDGSMIPEDGRDVQCSNCGHTWFELPTARGRDATDETDTKLVQPTVEETEDFGENNFDETDENEFAETGPQEENPGSDEGVSAPDHLSRAEFLDEDQSDVASQSEEIAESGADEDEDEDDDTLSVDEDEEPQGSATDETLGDLSNDDDVQLETDEPEADDQDTPMAATQRRPADAAALDILREEAERELSQRRAPPSETLETQADLGLETIRNRRTPSRALRARMAHMGENAPETEEDFDEQRPPAKPRDMKSRLVSQPDLDDAAYEEPRRDLLPDIEEINSTLKTAPKGRHSTEAASRSGFRVGFLLVLFLVGAAIFSYVQAPAIARALPDAEPAMITYVDQVNDVRDWIDEIMGNTTD